MPLDTLLHSMATTRHRSESLMVRARESGIGTVMTGQSVFGALTQARLLGSSQKVDPDKHYTGWPAACIRVTGQRVAGQEIVVARKTRGPVPSKSRKLLKHLVPKNLHDRIGNLEILEDHPLVSAIRKPNQLQLKHDMIFVMVAGLELTGQCFLWVRDEEDGTKSIWPIPSHWMRPIYGKKIIHEAWEICPDLSTETFIVPGEQVVYCAYANPNSPMRPSVPLQMAGRPVLIDEQIQECQRRSFRSPHPAMAVHIASMPDQIGLKGSKPELAPEQKARIEGMIMQMYAGAMNYDKPIILDGWIDKLEMLSKTVKEMDYNNSAKAIKERITQLFQTNPISLGHVEGANRASSLTADQNFLSININPKIEMLSEVFTYKLAPLFAQENEELVVWIVPAITIDRELDLQEANSARDRGALTTDEYRHMIGQPPLYGKIGNSILVPTTFQMVPVDEDSIPDNEAVEDDDAVAVINEEEQD